MSHFSNKSSGDVQHIQEVVKKIFPQSPARVERVTEGVSTYVYRIIFAHETFYMRVLPEEGASFSLSPSPSARLWLQRTVVAPIDL
jgi:hypothetical protein